MTDIVSQSVATSAEAALDSDLRPSADMPPAIWRHVYRMGATSPHVWVLSALRLVRSADVILLRVGRAERLMPESINVALNPHLDDDERHAAEDELTSIQEDASLFEVALMLLGFGLENLAKATLVRRGNAALGEDALAKSLRTHNLKALVTRCGVRMTPGQEYVVQILARQVIWSGRYPVPLHYSELEKRHDEILDAPVGPMSKEQIVLHAHELWTSMWEALHEDPHGSKP